MTWGRRNASRMELSARPARWPASLRVSFSQTMRSRAILSLPVTLPARDRPSMASFCRVTAGTMTCWLSVMGWCPLGGDALAVPSLKIARHEPLPERETAGPDPLQLAVHAAVQRLAGGDNEIAKHALLLVVEGDHGRIRTGLGSSVRSMT